MLSRKTGLWLFWIGAGTMAFPGTIWNPDTVRMIGFGLFCAGGAIIWNAKRKVLQ